MADVPTPLEPQQLEALKHLVGKRSELDADRRALVEELAKQHGIPMQPIKGTMEEIGDAAKVAALPMAGQLAFGTVGAMTGNPALVLAGESAGGLIGTKANELLGISKPGIEDYALSAGIPYAGAGLMKLARKLTPGHSAAEQQIGVGELRKMPGMLEGSKQAVDTAYAQVGNMKLPTANFSATVNDLLSTEAIMRKYGAHNPAVKRAMMATAQELSNNPSGIPMSEVNALLKRYREKVAGLEGKGGEQYGAYKALRQGLFKDMDDAVAKGIGTDALLLRQAMGEAKKRIAKDEFTELLAQHGTRHETVLGQTFEVIQPTKLLNKLHQMEFDKSVGKSTFDKISQTLKQLAKIERPSESFRTGIGSEGRAIALAGAGIIGSAAGAEHGAQGVLGGGAGSALAAYGAIKVHDAVAGLFMSDRGRKFLVKLFTHNKGQVGARTAQVLQFAAAQFQGTGESTPQSDRDASAFVEMAVNPDLEAERRGALGIPNRLDPRLETQR
jgi:hypothetical protein